MTQSVKDAALRHAIGHYICNQDDLGRYSDEAVLELISEGDDRVEICELYETWAPRLIAEDIRCMAQTLEALLLDVLEESPGHTENGEENSPRNRREERAWELMLSHCTASTTFVNGVKLALPEHAAELSKVCFDIVDAFADAGKPEESS
jgi:hypothetical protein